MQAVTNKTLEKLKYDLVREGLVEFDVVNQATQIALSQNTNIGQVLINSGVITEDAILKFLEEKLHIPFVNLNDYSLDRNTLKYISYNDAKKYKILPLFKIENVLTVAMADPMDLLKRLLRLKKRFWKKLMNITMKNPEPIKLWHHLQMLTMTGAKNFITMI